MIAPKTIAERLAEMEARAKQCGVSVLSIFEQVRITPEIWADWRDADFIPSESLMDSLGAALAMLIEASDPGPIEVQVSQW